MKSIIAHTDPTPSGDHFSAGIPHSACETAGEMILPAAVAIAACAKAVAAMCLHHVGMCSGFKQTTYATRRRWETSVVSVTSAPAGGSRQSSWAIRLAGVHRTGPALGCPGQTDPQRPYLNRRGP